MKKRTQDKVKIDRLRNIWSGMRLRCQNPKCDSWKYYGGKGVKVCEEWNNGLPGFYTFVAWALSHGYAEDLTIDRIDSNGDYEPSNCRWITAIENATRAKFAGKFGLDYDHALYVFNQHLEQAAARAGISMQQIADELKIDSFEYRKTRGMLTERDLMKVAAILGATFDYSFTFPDGTKL